MKIIAIGDNVVDCYLDQGKYYPGGNCVNVAVNCKRSGAEDVSYIGIFATDDKADHLKNVLELEGIPYHRSRMAEGISGQPRVNLTEDGDRVFVGGPKNTVQHILKLRLTPEDYEYIKDFDVAHTSCYSSMEEELPGLAQHINVSYDFSDKYNAAQLEKVCPSIKHGFFSGAHLSDEELENLVEELGKYTLETIGITRGSKPALFIHQGTRYYQDVYETEIVDTMGAGDSFIAGFLTAFYTHKDMRDALDFAAKRASITCGFYGGFGYPKDLE
ncbi:PfkB family carbohydrate kinase [Neobacillus sp. 179-C4.2 HS]|uniref:PfkB family carbohydrate kinase n=1 Tax=Neobacillus driksii TaxID=3035913 RepID=A0ABV4YYK8_9BACI|nr:PfkB family carbohydrate kinase [Neobacillus sp. 179.-C4.2 HS]MDP5194511.1 PfkB family carbohydrate kinase [Neobacillus sp. 179.-C4.2 HS]